MYTCVVLQCVNRLSMETRQIVGGAHNRKTSSFVKVPSSGDIYVVVLYSETAISIMGQLAVHVHVLFK